jgi:glycerophosphoryl diester phosphodiesterase
LTAEPVQVWGHGPEDGSGPAINTLASYDWCRGLGVDGVELDLRRTADDRLVVIHDAVLADGRAVADTMRADLPAFVPDLAAVLDACAGLTVNVEVKNFASDPGFDPQERVTNLLVDLLQARGPIDDVIVSCFGIAALDVINVRAPRRPTAALLLSRRPAAEVLDPVVGHRHATVHPYDTMVDDAFMEAARARGLTVNAWIGDVSAERMRALYDLGVGALITSDVAVARRVADAVNAKRGR